MIAGGPRTRALVGWALTRSLVVLWWSATPYGALAATDLNRYAYFATGERPELELFPWEYPALARGLLSLDFGAGFSTYVGIFTLLMFAVDLVFLLWLLGRGSQRGSMRGAWAWIVLPPLLGVLAYTRYDMPVAIAVAVALSMAATRPRIAAILLSAATALKLWPIMLLPLVVARAPKGLRLTVSILGLVPWLAIEALGVAHLGWRSITSPWQWQAERGLQLESVLAAPLRYLTPGSDSVSFRFNAWELGAPGWVHTVLTLAGASLLLGVLVIACNSLRHENLPRPRRDQVLLSSAVLLIAVLIVTGKVLSPQYLMWLIPVLAVGVDAGCYRRPDIPVLLAIACILTTIVYPVSYGAVLTGQEWAWTLLLLRNLTLMGLTVLLFVSWRHTKESDLATAHTFDSVGNRA